LKRKIARLSIQLHRVQNLSDGNVVPVTDKMRMLFMGNALVTEIVKGISDYITQIKNKKVI